MNAPARPTGASPATPAASGSAVPATEAATSSPGATPAAKTVSTPLAVLVAAALTLLVLAVLLPNLWYGLHDISDIGVYHGYAERIADGESPFTPSFRVEYPPLAVPLFRIPGHTGDLPAYTHWFSMLMGRFTVATAAVTALVACRLWPRGGRAYVAAVLFPMGVALTGAIIVNRYDVVVALLIAMFLLCLSRGWYTAAGVRHRHGVRTQDNAGRAAPSRPAARRTAAALASGPWPRSPPLPWRPSSPISSSPGTASGMSSSTTSSGPSRSRASRARRCSSASSSA